MAEGNEDMPPLDLAEEDDLLRLDEPDEVNTFENGNEGSKMDTEAGDEKPQTPVNTGWVDILEKENDLKLMSELNKIGKLRSNHDKQKDFQTHYSKHRISLYPVYPEDLVDPYLLGVINKCVTTNVQFHLVRGENENEPQIKGMLDLRFAKYSDAVAEKEKLSALRDDICVLGSRQGNDDEDYAASMNKWKKLAGMPDKANDLTLYAPSLPDTVTQNEMWELFPLARELMVVPEQPRQHAYIKFASEELLQKSIQDLKVRGPPRADFNFCRLVRYSRIAQILHEAQTKKNAAPAVAGTATSPARPTTSSGGKRGPRKHKRKAGEQQASVGQAEPKPKAAPAKAKAKQPKAANQATQNTASAKTNQKANPKSNQKNGAPKKFQGRGTQQQQQQWVRPGARTSNNNWYSDRRAMHLERARNPVRATQQSRPLLNTSAGIQMLGNLLTSLGQLSNGAPHQGNGQQAASQPRGTGARGNQRPAAQAAYRQNAAPPANRRNRDGGQWLPPRSDMRASPTKRAHSMEDLDQSGSQQQQSGKNKRRRKRRQASMHDSYEDSVVRNSSYRQETRPSSSLSYRSEYETPRRGDVSGGYSSTTDYNRPAYNSYSGSQTTSTPLDRLRVLDTLSRLSSSRQTSTSQALQNPGRPQTTADYYGSSSSYYR